MSALTFSAYEPSVETPTPAAASTTSKPRNTSPLASASVLPCSAVMSAASAGVCSRMSAASAIITRARACVPVTQHSHANLRKGSS